MITHVAINHRLGIFKLPLEKHVIHYDVACKMVNEFNIEDAHSSGEDGFVTADGAFLDRITAKKYAAEHGQIKHRMGCAHLLSEELV